jgi:hypothetical protein
VDKPKTPVIETPDPSGSALTASPQRADEIFLEGSRWIPNGQSQVSSLHNSRAFPPNQYSYFAMTSPPAPAKA